MKQLLLNEFLADVNFMGLINIDYPLSSIGEPDLLNNMLLVDHGFKAVAKNYISASKESLAKMIVLTHRKKWDSLMKVLETNINILSDNVQLTNENVKGNNIYTDDSNSLDKVSAFNSESLVDNTGNENNSTHTGNDNRDRVQTVTNTNLGNAVNNLQIIQDLNIIETILNDVSNYFTLSIYKDYCK